MTKTSNDLQTDQMSDQVAAARQDAFDAVVNYSERLAHDANNYIGAILGLSEVLPAIADDPEQVSLIATRIAAAGRLLQVVVNQALLPVARHDDSPSIDLDTAHDIATRLATHLVAPRIAFHLLSSDATGGIALTQGELSVLLFVLLRNACDAAELHEGTSPQIHVSFEALSGDALEADLQAQDVVRGTKPGGSVLALRVRDNGCGLKTPLDENVALAFQPFVSHSRRRSALGLGLTFAFAIAERRGGALGVRQTGDTQFTAYLPLGDAAVQGEVIASDDIVPQVLIVDPLMQWGAATATLLGLLDWPARQIGTIDEALVMLEAASRHRHVLVIRQPRHSISARAAARLEALIQARHNVDLVLLIGATNAIASDDEAAASLARAAAMPLCEDAAPADIVNYLIPNI